VDIQDEIVYIETCRTKSQNKKIRNSNRVKSTSQVFLMVQFQTRICINFIVNFLFEIVEFSSTLFVFLETSREIQQAAGFSPYSG